MANKLMSGLGGLASGAAAGTAVGGPLGTIIGGGIGLLGGLFGGGDDKEAEAQAAYQAAAAQILGLQDLDPTQLQVKLKEYALAGKITPELEQSIQQEASKMEGISTDPRLKQAQMGALDKLSKVGEEGLTDQDRLALNSARRDIARDTQGRQEAIIQNMQARGAGGSGAELAAQLAASQAGAERGSQEADRTASMANQRALEAIMKRADLGGNIRSQDFSEQARIAQAQDEIARFNTANKQSVQQRNVGSLNDAQRANLAATQATMNANVGLSNEEQMYNKKQIADDYERRMRKAQAAAGVYSGQGDRYTKAGQQEGQQFTDILKGVGTAAAGIKDAFGKKTAVAEEPQTNQQRTVSYDTDENGNKRKVITAAG